MTPECKIHQLVEATFRETLVVKLRFKAAGVLSSLLLYKFKYYFLNLPEEEQNKLKELFLKGVVAESSVIMRQQLCRVIGILVYGILVEDNLQWPKLIPFLFSNASSAQVHHREISLFVFGLVPGCFGNSSLQLLSRIKAMLTTSLNDYANPTVQFLAVKATVSFHLLHDSEVQIQKSLCDMLPVLLDIIIQSVHAGKGDLLKCVEDIAKTCPKYLRPQLEDILLLIVTVLPDKNNFQSVRHMLLKVFVTLAETAAAMVREVPDTYLKRLILQLMTMMSELEEDENWHLCEEQVEEDCDCCSFVAERSLDRLACGLGGKTVFPHIKNTLTDMLNSESWKCRHAALMVISAVGEGCHKQMEAMLPQIMKTIIRVLKDSHPRVRFAACNAIIQMATDFAPVFQKFHEIVVPGLIHVMEDPFARVQAHAGKALVNFYKVCPKNILTTYLPSIIYKLDLILQERFMNLNLPGNRLVLEQVVSTIATVADTAEKHFIQYYDKFIPRLMYMIEGAHKADNAVELRVLRGKTIQCVSLIGWAVGRENFMDDAAKMMDLLLAAQTGEEMDDDDPQVKYIISSGPRICKIIGARFEPYLHLFMGPVLKTIYQCYEIAPIEECRPIHYNVDGWVYLRIGIKHQFGIKIKFIEAKADAIQMLYIYARELKKSFADYAEEVVRLIVPMLKSRIDTGIRTAVAQILPYLLECAQIKGSADMIEMWGFILPELLKALETEPQREVLSEQLYAMAKCIEVMGVDCLNDEQLNELVKILEKSLTEHFERAKDRHEKRKDEDYDQVVEKQLMDEDDEDTFAPRRVSDVLHALFAAYKEAFYTKFDHLLPQIEKLVSPERSWSDLQRGLCIFDDVIEYGGPHCSRYMSKFLEPLLNHITHTQAEVRQASAYGCGVLAQFGGPEFAGVCSQALPKLVQVIQDPDARTESNVKPTENAIAAVTKILKYNSSHLTVDEVIPVWLSFLPVWEDTVVAPHVYGYLCDLLEANNHHVL